MKHLAFACALLVLSTPALAMRLVLLEEKHAQGPIITKIGVEDVLGETPKPHLKLYPERNAEHGKLIDILAAGMPFEEVGIRDQTAEILAGFPGACKPVMGMSMMVSPIEHIDTILPGVRDKRRIVALFVGNCLAERLEECVYDQDDTGEVNFELGNLLGILKECRDATNAAVERGAPYSEDVYKTEPASPSLAPATAYFRDRAQKVIPKLPEPTDADAMRFIRTQPDWHRLYVKYEFTPANIAQCLSDHAADCSRPWEECPRSVRRLNSDWNAKRIHRDKGALKFRGDDNTGEDLAFGWFDAFDDAAQCRSASAYAAMRERMVGVAKLVADGEQRIARDQVNIRNAHAQIADARHHVAALTLKQNVEAQYLHGCLHYAHPHAAQSELGAMPSELDPAVPFNCAFYSDNDYRAVFINGMGLGEKAALEAFEKVTQSKQPRIAARAWWNLAVLYLETDPEPTLLDWVQQEREKAGTLEYAGKPSL